jgi:putative ABC transport system permease protein
MNKLVIGNLVHRPLRSLISVFAIAIEVVMILVISTVTFGGFAYTGRTRMDLSLS